MMSYKIILTIMMFACFKAEANSKKYETVINAAFNNNFEFATVPWIKEYLYLNSGKITNVEKAVERVVFKAGSKNFEALSKEVLSKNSSSVSSYILGKKFFSSNHLDESMKNFSKVSSHSMFYAHSLYAIATISALQNNYIKAKTYFNNCKEEASKFVGDDDEVIKKSYKLVRDLCITGVSRMTYAEKNYEKADTDYIELDKKSIIWPTILIEEAWSSFYQKNYNRTLGKLVSYKAPLLNFVINPEIDVLRAFTYMTMCLYNDMSLVIEDFYKSHENYSNHLESMILKNKDPLFYYRWLQTDQTSQFNQIENLISHLRKDPAIKLISENIAAARLERQKLSKTSIQNYRIFLEENLDEFESDQMRLVGIMVRNKIQRYHFDLKKSFEYMSYMKLEYLGKMKQFQYRGQDYKGKRGDVKYIKRNDKQYFWNFKGEFWGDELGDYVFALPAECSNE